MDVEQVFSSRSAAGLLQHTGETLQHTTEPLQHTVETPQNNEKTLQHTCVGVIWGRFALS